MSTTAQIAKIAPITTMAARATVRLAWRALEVRRHSGSTPAKMTSERSVGGAMPDDAKCLTAPWMTIGAEEATGKVSGVNWQRLESVLRHCS